MALTESKTRAEPKTAIEFKAAANSKVATDSKAAADWEAPDDSFKVLLGGKERRVAYRRATKAQITLLHHDKAHYWAAPFNTSEYMELSSNLAKLEGIINLPRSSWWVLHPVDDPNLILSSCTILLRDVIVNTGEGSRRATAAVIKDLFTHVEYRRAGLARLLLKCVQKTLDTKKGDRVVASVLWSSNYVTLAKELGWKPFRSTQLRLVIDGKPSSQVGRGKVRFLTINEMGKLAAADVNTCKTRLSGVRRGRATAIQFLPNALALLWHMGRSQVVAELLSKEMPGPKGAMITTDEAYSYQIAMWWTPNFLEKRLYVTRLVRKRKAKMLDEMKRMLATAAEYAHEQGLEEVVLWDTDEDLYLAAVLVADETDVSVVCEYRRDQVPCLRLRNGEEQEVEWPEMQYYSYC